MIARFPAVMNNPFHIELCEGSLKTVLVLLCMYGLGIGVYFSSRRNYRRGEEHGSAKWGNARAVNKKYRARAPEENKIFTQNVRVGLDGRKHRRNLNTVVVGGSGAVKQGSTQSRIYVRRTPLLLSSIPKGSFCGTRDICLNKKAMRCVFWICSIWKKAIATIRLSTCGTTTMCRGL